MLRTGWQAVIGKDNRDVIVGIAEAPNLNEVLNRPVSCAIKNATHFILKVEFQFCLELVIAVFILECSWANAVRHVARKHRALNRPFGSVDCCYFI